MIPSCIVHISFSGVDMKKPVITFLLITIINVINAATINIPADQPTIQAGIDNISIGDTILIALGTYGENILFHHKSPILIGESGTDSSIIIGNQGYAIYR